MLQVEIRVRGRLDPSWSEWLDNLTIVYDGEDATVISGPLRDQAALYGLLTRMRDLGLVLLLVRTFELVG